MSCIIFGLSDPKIDIPAGEMKYKNVRIFFLVDVSRSMVYAEDVVPNRLEAVKKELIDFYGKLDGQYEISVIPFAGSPNVYYCPLNYSKSVTLPIIEALDGSASSMLGTNIVLALKELQNYINELKLDSGNNLIVLLTDGGKEESDAANKTLLQKIVQELSSKNSRVYTVGVGGKDPCLLVQRNERGAFIDYIKVDDKISYSHLDEEILKQVAIWGKGEYVYFSETGTLYNFLVKTLKENRVVEGENIVYKRIAIQCYLFATAAVILGAMYFCNRKFGKGGSHGK